MTTPDVFTYADQPFRTKVIAGEPCVLLADVITALSMRSTPAQVSQRLPEGVRRTDTLLTPGGAQRVTWVTEAGLYRVVLRSDAPNAEPFIEWVTQDVIPTIRKTGRYGSEVDLLASLPSSKVLALAAEAAKRAEDAEQRAAALEGPAARWHEVASAAGDFSVGDVAKILCRAGINTGQNRLFKLLDEKRWTFRRGESHRRAMQSAVDAGLLVERTVRPVTNPRTGELRQVPPQIRVTGKGLDRLLADHGCSRINIPELTR